MDTEHPLHTMAEHYKGLAQWVQDYRTMRAVGNVQGAKLARDNIKTVIEKHGLDANRVWGADPDAPL